MSYYRIRNYSETVLRSSHDPYHNAHVGKNMDIKRLASNLEAWQYYVNCS